MDKLALSFIQWQLSGTGTMAQSPMSIQGFLRSSAVRRKSSTVAGSAARPTEIGDLAPGLPNFTGAFVGMMAFDQSGAACPADFARFSYVRNPGAAMGLFHSGRWLLIGVSFATSLLLIAQDATRARALAG